MNKKESILCHKLLVLHTLTMEVLDDLKTETVTKERYKDIFQPSLDYVERFLEESAIIDNSLNKRTNYIFELSKKVDTIIRKNYELL